MFCIQINRKNKFPEKMADPEEDGESEKRYFKLNVHTPSFFPEDLIIRSEDFPDIVPGDVVEIYHEEEKFSRLLLQVKPENLYPGNNLKNIAKEVVYVEKSIAETFHLLNFKNVVVNKIEKEKISLDVVELLFKDQYMGRSEMWRLKNSLINSVVFINKKVNFCKDTIRCTVLEMWNQGEKLACGLVTQDTKVVFRSTTAMVYLFIQMSSEMWHFDMNGDLYFEKAVNGFLYEMFYKWKKTGAAHEVTIVLFSRIFYDAKDLSEFPLYMTPCLQKDYRDRFYEDFYRVVVQNEKFEDWFPTLNLLRQTFTNYKELVLNYHQRPGVSIPRAYNSTAAQGNFLETLNISLNTFEKHFINRNLDRTGQQAMVITPGVGIFEVDRDLTVITKQRMIDSGVGSDLLCVGEQPLHAVPLFKMHAKHGGHHDRQEDFSMPWWINLSFYTSNKKIGYSTFIPRIKLPPLKSQAVMEVEKSCYFPASVVSSAAPQSPFEYDEYDAQVFNLPSNKPFTSGSLTRLKKQVRRNMRKGSSEMKKDHFKIESHRKSSRQGSYDDSFYLMKKDSSRQNSLSITPSISIPAGLKESGKGAMMMIIYLSRGMLMIIHLSRGSYDDDYLYPNSVSTYTQRMYHPAGRALINPFDASHVTVKLTSNRRRWTHIFPKGPTGTHKQAEDRILARLSSRGSEHKRTEGRHSPADSTSSGYYSTLKFDWFKQNLIKGYRCVSSMDSLSPLQFLKQRVFNYYYYYTIYLFKGEFQTKILRHRLVSNSEVKFGTFMWGATGEQTLDATIATGVDWKSITYPACLPVTTDYKPDQRTLETEYLISEYNLSPDEHNSEHMPRSPLQKPPLSTREVFTELISQRLSQNFQLIIIKNESLDKTDGNMTNPMNSSGRVTSLVRTFKKPASEEYWLSIGKIFHKLSLTGQMINVVRYSPKHPYPNLHYRYMYRFLAPDNDTYETSWVEFNMEKLETYNWNYLDFYVCTRGDQDYYLSESLKYWRYRMYVLPLRPFVPYTKAIIEGPEDMRCDIYTRVYLEDRVSLAEGFLKFIETCLNKLKRPTPLPVEKQFLKGRSNTMAGELKPPGANERSKFRERLGSNRAVERSGRDRAVSGPPRPIERARTESGSARLEPDLIKPLANIQISDSFSDSQESVFNTSVGNLQDYQLVRKAIWRDAFLNPRVKENEFKLLRSSCTNEEIVEAMRSVPTGLTILPKQEALPNHTFVSADAVVWLIEHVEGIDEESSAVQLMSSLLKDGYICHASGHPSHPFIHGFYLYFFNTKEKDGGSIYNGDWEAFQADWMEVELDYCRPQGEEEGGLRFLEENLPDRYTGTDKFRACSLDPDISKKSERPEWGEVKYQSKYRPDQAFEILIKWSVATGALLAELIKTWTIRAQTNQLFIIPIPGDPFALPSQNSDPIRGPIFVPLNTDCLRVGGEHLFYMFPESTRDHRLFLFREEIVKRRLLETSIQD
ncbi:GATOR complex protein DEPDC5 [Eurytemora carolleeae]|uniref:GATOR complex protein DEPDC5 n=1 Tax=Eurytemora carolleeae TaxID=1294199 RepID=UPI000C75C8B7|nr:GATOR complex protein DEPDC5 [Eurytemora carolleeae]|eukprot:XP_023323795.1 GATOR complex protein DEPDC5-like [Eurytemora affinis]